MELSKLQKRKQKALDENNQQLIAEFCNKIGTLYYNKNEWEKSLSEFKQEEKIYAALNMRMDLGKANRRIAEVYLLQNKFTNALNHAEIYRKTSKEENNLVELQRSYATIGRIYLLKAQERDNEASDIISSDLKSAEKAFLKSLIISKEVSKDVSKFQLADMQSRIYLNLGVTKEEMKSFDAAIDYYKTALKICKTNDLFDLEHKCLMCIGLCYTTKYSNTLNAMQNFNQALEVAKRIDGKNERICETLIAKSDLLIKNGDFQSAKKVLKKAYRLKTTIESDAEIIQKNLKIIHTLCKFEDDLITTDSFDYETRKKLFEKLADGSCKLKNYKKGIDFYLKQLEAAELNGETGRTLIPIYISLYQTYIDLGEYDDAMKYLELEYELIKDEPKESCSTLKNKGYLMEKAGKFFWDIDAVYRKALSEARRAEDKVVEKYVIQRLVKLSRSNKMESLAEILELEANERGINLNSDSDEVELSEDLLADSCDIDVLDFELSSDPDSSDNEKSITQKATVRKKRSIAVKKNAKGETKLHEACIAGNYQLVKMLLDQGHPVNLRDNAGWMCIHEASNHGYRDIVELLLDNGAQINDKGGVKCEGITPLYDAASNGHLSVVQLLLDRGAKTTIRSDSNQTSYDALMYWYEKNCGKLTPSEKELFDEIRERLERQCEKVGIDTTKINTSNSSSGYASNKSKSSQNRHQQPDMRYNTKYSESSDDENVNHAAHKDDEDCYDKTHDPDVNDDYIKKNARHEYKSVMQKLKNPHKYSTESVYEQKKRSAYLSEEEVDVDEWLEDDLGPNRKKQRKFFSENIVNVPQTTQMHQQNDLILSRKSSTNLICSDENNEESLLDFVGNSMDAFDVLMSTNGDGGMKKSRRNSNTAKLQRKSSNQSSLLDAGFSKFIDFDDSSRRSFTVSSPVKVCSTPPSNNISLNESSSRGSLTGAEKQTIIKVQIEGEKIIVPINRDAANELKISWLIEEAARRYYCLKGIRPELLIKTADGATLMDADPLSLILCLTEENLIFSEILDWKLPTLSNRYLEACSEYKCVVDRDINEMLDLNRTSINIDLSNQNLRPTTIRPILKALHHQHCLTHLDLSNNFIQDEGLKYLSQALVTLKNLSYLDLSGNGITENGIEHFCTTMFKSTFTGDLKQLKLNFNPIKSNSLKHLAELCRHKSITSLSLAACRLIDFDNEIEAFCTLKELNISFNHFTYNGLRNFLRKLNATCMEVLNLDRCTSELNVGANIVNFITSGCSSTLKEINLSGLKLDENEILDILRSLQPCEHLKFLDLSYLNELTVLTMKFLLFNMNNGNVRINVVGCQKLHRNFNIKYNRDDQTVSMHPCHIQLSLPRYMSTVERDEYVTNVRDLWIAVSESRGTIHQDKNILHLLADNHRNVQEFL